MVLPLRRQHTRNLPRNRKLRQRKMMKVKRKSCKMRRREKKSGGLLKMIKNKVERQQRRAPNRSL